MVVALKPLHDAARIRRINVATYQSVSGTGKKAIEELAGETAALLNGQPIEPKVYPKQIAFNALPQIDTFQDNGYTREEMKMVWETRKILGDADIEVNPTCVRIPVFYGHSEAVHIEFERPLGADEAARAAGRCAGHSGGGRAGSRRLSDSYRGGRPGLGLCRAYPRGHHASVWAQSVGGVRQHSQGCRHQQRADRRAADRGVPRSLIALGLFARTPCANLMCKSAPLQDTMGGLGG